MQPYLIAPSLLSANFARLGAEAEAVLNAGADVLHLDVMDNHYVPNLTVGPLVCQALRNDGITAPIDVHLMVNPVDSLIVEFAKAGATYITIHPEATEHLDRSLTLIRDHGVKAGVALNPATDPNCLNYILDKLDLILVMSVNPGFGGQAFIPSALEKLKKIRMMIADLPIRLSIDGGVKAANIALTAKAGADMFVLGSAIFTAPSFQGIIKELRDELKQI